MGLASREKGKRGERLLAEELRQQGFNGAKRGQQVSGLETADVVGVVPGLRFESKHGSAVAPKLIYANLTKLANECTAGELPVLCLHRTEQYNGGKSAPWLAVVPLRFFTRTAICWLQGLGYTVTKEREL
jgi:hypothetical protein